MMLSGGWNIWATGFLFALLAAAFVVALAFHTSGIVDLHEVLFICVVGFIAGLAVATVRNWFVDQI
jgi:hypothetical protein